MTGSTSAADDPGASRPAARPPPRTRGRLGPFALISPFWLALKAGAASGVALLLAQATACPDLVSTTFVAVLCTSPTVLLGMRLATAQLLGSAVGGACGAAMVAAGVPVFPGIPLAVFLAVGASFAMRYPKGYQAAAFTALFVQAIPRGGPMDTLAVRILAIAIAALSGFVVNVVVSARAYRAIFTDRLRRVEEHCDSLLVEAAAAGPSKVSPAFDLLSLMERELAGAQEELTWRGDEETAFWLGKISARVYAIHHLLHLVYDLGLLMEDHAVPLEEVRPFLEWVRCGEGERPAVPPALGACASRIEALWGTLHQRVEDP